MQEQGIINEQLKRILSERLPEIRQQALTGKAFQVDCSEGKALQGRVRFLRIASVEGGFCAPESALKVISELNAVEQWRN